MGSGIGAAAAVVALAGLVSCGGDDADESVTPSTVASPPVRLVVDTDLAADDIVALSYLTRHERIDLIGVTVSGTGEVRCPRGADVARGLLAMMDLGDVPVACGTSQPRAGDRQFPAEWRTAADNAWGLVIESVAPPTDPPTAVELLGELIGSEQEPATLLALGPLTNVAELFDAEPSAADALAALVVMGGALGVPGNVQPDPDRDPLPAEWNFYVDPAAAQRVLEAGAAVTIVPLDATNAVPVGEPVVARLEANDTTDATRRVLRLFHRFAPPYLWDPLAAVVVAEPELVPTRDTRLAVLTEGADWGRTVERDAGASARVATAPDTTAVLDHLIRTLADVPDDGALATPTTLPVLAELTVGFDGSTCTYSGPDELAAGRYRIERTEGDVPYTAVFVHLIDGATIDEAVAWAAAHPNEQPPMVDEIAMVADDLAETADGVVLSAGRVGVVCVTEPNQIHVATTLGVS